MSSSRYTLARIDVPEGSFYIDEGSGGYAHEDGRPYCVNIETSVRDIAQNRKVHGEIYLSNAGLRELAMQLAEYIAKLDAMEPQS